MGLALATYRSTNLPGSLVVGQTLLQGLFGFVLVYCKGKGLKESYESLKRVHKSNGWLLLLLSNMTIIRGFHKLYPITEITAGTRNAGAVWIAYFAVIAAWILVFGLAEINARRTRREKV